MYSGSKWWKHRCNSSTAALFTSDIPGTIRSSRFCLSYLCPSVCSI